MICSTIGFDPHETQSRHMNKSQLVDAAAQKASMTKKDVNMALDALLEAITEAIAGNDKVTLVGFGTFEAKLRQAREGRNPSSGESITIPSRMMPKFSPGKALKDAVEAEAA